MQIAHIVNVVGRAEPRQDQQQKRLHFPIRVQLFLPPQATFSLSVSGRGPAQPAPLNNTCHVPTISSHRESGSEPLAGAALINHRLVRGLCGALILRWGDLRTEGPTNVGKRVRLRAGRLMPGKGTCPSCRMPTGSQEAAGTFTSLARSSRAGS